MSLLQAGRPSKGAKETKLEDISESVKTIRVNFDLPEDMHTELKMYALKEKKSVKDVLTEQIKQLLIK
ncbi:chromosome partitioning protein ParB [Acinetobacter sp. ME22]|uniref:chromosome partitioning protein ParB n=1 Tax=Acinetobacter sp. ME22 TaxID=2904802 RepID=UPI001EDC8F58|nr:chromosome partitioning protein ParB [Acinetobacter sp. ME22]MCG2574927.1 chromosome partitioning protein ParB [Acinetobacter sp. ME22]